MDFFEHQDRARKNTARLAALFALAVVLIIAVLYGVILLALAWSGGALNPWQPGLLAVVAGGSVLTITTGSVTKTVALRSGGHVVAEDLGGVPLDREGNDLDEQRLLNVVEEMAIASGTPVPAVYVLEEEGINAFAAGNSPDDAVIGVTRGCIHLLSRAELQGVIAHEFSHILNGDMRTNIRLIGVLHGILLISTIGRVVMRSAAFGAGRSRDRDSRGQLAFLVIGLAMFVTGIAGMLCGRMIKSAISRQREYLADASAVQFTRNPDGIAGALKKIGGHVDGAKVEAPKAEESSHLFFGSALGSGLFKGGLFATHPPLDERITRIDPSFDGAFPQVEAPGEAAGASSGDGRAAGLHGGEGTAAPPASPSAKPADQVVGQTGTLSAAHMAYGTEARAAIPKPLRTAAHEPLGAVAIAYGLLLDGDDALRAQQLDVLRTHAPESVADETEHLFPALRDLNRRLRLPLLELAAPALRDASTTQIEQLRANVRRLVAADDQLSIFEYALQKILQRRLAHVLGDRSADRVRFKSFDAIEDDAVLLLSALARVGHPEAEGARLAFRTGLRCFSAVNKGDAGFRNPVERVSPQAIDGVLDRLAATSPALKKEVIDACAHCVLTDETVTVQEAELLRAIATALDVPVPPFLTAIDQPAQPQRS